jgi:hypothetical protein
VDGGGACGARIPWALRRRRLGWRPLALHCGGDAERLSVITRQISVANFRSGVHTHYSYIVQRWVLWFFFW